MANESKSFFDKRDQEKKLVKFYDDLISGNANPSIEYQKQFLLQLLNTKISQLEPNTNKKKKLHFFLRIVTMILSGTSTVLLGYKFDNTTGLSTNFKQYNIDHYGYRYAFE